MVHVHVGHTFWVKNSAQYLSLSLFFSPSLPLPLSLFLPQFAGILKPYRGECLLDPPPNNAGPAGATEFTRWNEVVRE